MTTPPSSSFTLQLLRTVQRSSYTSLTLGLAGTAGMAYLAAHESRRISKTRDCVTFCEPPAAAAVPQPHQNNNHQQQRHYCWQDDTRHSPHQWQQGQWQQHQLNR
mmetsp:Transcript_50934/g.122795  ORF Transcript_50934/g.122795 Transcript_50934/m.122795 type:complete len:105 (+) Transcript_50934:296-610(+)